MSTMIYDIYLSMLCDREKLCMIDDYKATRDRHGWVWYCDLSINSIDKFLVKYGVFDERRSI